MSLFVEFSISSPERFAALQRAFSELKHKKDVDAWESTEELLSYFDAESLSHFYWPPDDVRRQRLEDLKTRPVIETPTEQAAGRTWDFDSLIDAFMDGEYNLLSCEMTEDGQARLNFCSLAYPYGGVGCMVALVEAFGCVVTGIQDGTGFVSFKRPDVTVVEGDLLDQDVDVIVNAWNRNIIPWWLLLPQGVSGAIKRRGGTGPFIEVGMHGAIPLGGAVLTSAGKLPFKGIIHVAGINMLWIASERSIRDSVKNAVVLAQKEGFRSIAFPLIGAGSGSFNQDKSKAVMLDELSKLEVPMTVKIVVFKAAT